MTVLNNSFICIGVSMRKVRSLSIVSWCKAPFHGQENASNLGNKSAKRLCDGNEYHGEKRAVRDTTKNHILV